MGRGLGAWLAVLLWGAGVAAAQEQTWSVVARPAGEELWGACYGGNQFVAVGRQGVILTSPDGLAWTNRVSGTGNWLLGVAYSGTGYVAVGEQGTILTSPDANTWTARAAGGARLNNVAYGNGLFLAVGEGGVVRRSLDGGVTWTTANIGAEGWLRAMVFARGEFLLGGQDGTLAATSDGRTFTRIAATLRGVEALAFEGDSYLLAGEDSLLASSRDGRNWVGVPCGYNPGDTGPVRLHFRGAAICNRHPVVADSAGRDGYGGSANIDAGVIVMSQRSPQRPHFAAAANSDRAVLVGQSEIVRVLLDPPVAPHVITDPAAEVVANVGGSVTLGAMIDSPGITVYQWLFNGVPLAGATSDALTLSPLSLAHGGSYALRASNPQGTVTAKPTVLTVKLAGPSGGFVDPGFRGTFTDAVPDRDTGRFVAGGSSAKAVPTCLAVQPDGRIVLAGKFFATSAGIASYGLTRLNRDGSVDAQFFSGIGFRGGEVSDLAVQADGRILAVGTFTSYAGQPAPGLIRLQSDGTPDPSFAPPAMGLPGVRVFALTGGRVLTAATSGNQVRFTRWLADGTVDPAFPIVAVPAIFVLGEAPLLSARLDDGSIVLSTLESDTLVDTTSRVIRLSPDGTLDPTFAIRSLPGTIQDLARVPGGKIAYRSRYKTRSIWPPVVLIFARLNSDGTEDRSYSPRSFPALTFDASPSVFFPDGRILRYAYATLSRLFSDGRDDPSLTARLDVQPAASAAYADNVITRFVALPDGQVLALGTFDQLNGVPTARIARLALDADLTAVRLGNLSVRAVAGSGDQTLIAGFVVAGGAAPHGLLFRGVGPTLADYGVADTLADPALALRSATAELATNDNWSSALAPTFTRVGAFALRAGSRDAALGSSLAPGLYTLQLAANNAAPGTALAEIYDDALKATPPADNRLVNLSARAELRSGSDTLIAGFVLAGAGTQRVLVRAIGPTLARYGVPRPLNDPILTLYRGNETLAVNNDWVTSPDNGAIFDLGAKVGAFPLDSTSRDAALVLDLPPGAYTAIIRSADGTAGAALVEIYAVP